MKIRPIETTNLTAKWVIESESHAGQFYTVTSRPVIDRDSGSMEFRMTCTCPSRRHPCKHIQAVDQYRYADGVTEEDYEIMERTTY